MLNQFVVVGKIKEILSEDDKQMKLTITVPRTYKNESGQYDNDILTCNLLSMIKSATQNYCEIGDMVGVKGRIQSNVDDVMELVAEKVTFLTSK